MKCQCLGRRSADAAGHDTAEFRDSSANDLFVATPEVATLTANGLVHHARAFERVNATATSGGDDLAQLSDSESIDHLVADADGVRLSNTQLDFLISVAGYEVVEATSHHGPDPTHVAAAVDYLVLQGEWEP